MCHLYLTGFESEVSSMSLVFVSNLKTTPVVETTKTFTTTSSQSTTANTVIKTFAILPGTTVTAQSPYQMVLYLKSRIAQIKNCSISYVTV